MPLKKVIKSLQFLLLLSLLAVLITGCLSVGAAPEWDENGPDGLVTVVEDSPDGDGNGEVLQLEVGIEPTPVPTSYPYSNSTYGYEISYPETWRVEEIDKGIEISKDDVRLIIQTWWTADPNPTVRWYGMPAGDLLYRDKVSFLGAIIPVNYLVYEGKTKQVLYNEGNPIDSGDLQILVYLESQGADYESIEVSDAIIAEAKMILESFQRTEHASPPPDPKGALCATEKNTPPDDWQLYRNDGYGFYLYHPRSMLVIETGEHLLEIHQGDLVLRIEFRKIDQAYALPGILQEGEVELTRFVNYFGDENPNPVVVERSGGLVTRVSVGNVFGNTTPVQFQVEITGPTGSNVNLDQADAMLEILDTLCLPF